jgi:hypothetical protein
VQLEWSRSDPPGNTQTGAEFINRIDIPSTPRLRDLDHATLPAAQECEELERCASGDFSRAMTTIYSARWVVPVTAAPIEHGAVAVEGQRIAGVGSARGDRRAVSRVQVESSAMRSSFPGLVNIHTHLELTAMRGYPRKRRDRISSRGCES